MEKITLAAKYVDEESYDCDTDAVKPVIVTYGCSCCSREEPMTRDNLDAAIAYHEDAVNYFKGFLAKINAPFE